MRGIVVAILVALLLPGSALAATDITGVAVNADHVWVKAVYRKVWVSPVYTTQCA